MAKTSVDKRIGVLMGGLSKERDISLKSGHAVHKALREIGCRNVAELIVGHDLAEKLKELKVEVAFIALHGRFGEDGSVQGLLEYLGIPYTGSGVLGSAVAMNKVVSKKIFVKEGIKTPDFAVYSRGEYTGSILKDLIARNFSFPIVVKPSCEGSTIGLSVVNKEQELDEAIKTGFRHDRDIVVERFINGTEITVGVLQGKSLPVVEIAPKEGIFDYTAKYTKGMTEYFVPARVAESIAKKAMDMALRAFNALECSSYGRVDMIVDGRGEIFVLEVNSIPGMTETSLVPMAAKSLGISFNDLVGMILDDASLKIGA